ncbi:MAG TPA: ABC transporter permease [Verrucomicrobiae bacterium]|jgi:ABC-2 type transport system permease protein|nr:ABC transporter permease [Verrucomicrobiae bacterium]
MRQFLTKQNRALLSELVRTDFKLRYQGSVLGYAWSLLRPLFIFAILYVVFIKFLHVDYGVPHSAVYLLLGIVIWNFFNEMTVLSLGSIVGRADLIRKIRIPRWIIVFSSSLSTVINLLLNLVVIGVFMAINNVSLSSTALLLPLILLEVYILGLGLSLFLSAAFVKYRDVSYIWEVVMQAGFYLTPLLYPISRLPSLTVKKLVLLNPMGQAIQDARYSLITHKTLTSHRIFNGGWHSLIPFMLVILIFVGGLAYFKSQANSFAENL